MANIICLISNYVGSESIAQEKSQMNLKNLKLQLKELTEDLNCRVIREVLGLN